MSLVRCSDCGEQVSTRAVSCPKCGAPVSVDAPMSLNVDVQGLNVRASERYTAADASRRVGNEQELFRTKQHWMHFVETRPILILIVTCLGAALHPLVGILLLAACTYVTMKEYKNNAFVVTTRRMFHKTSFS